MEKSKGRLYNEYVGISPSIVLFFQSILKKQWFVIVLLIAVIAPTFFSLIRPGYFPMQDDMQAFRVLEMTKCLQDGQIPCRWIKDAGYGFGYPLYNYYAPGVFYLGSLFHLIGLQAIDSVKLLFILGFIGSAIAMYLFLQSFINRYAAFIGALLYIYIPYRAAQVYVRGSLSEFWAFVVFPLVFWAIYKLITTNAKIYIVYSALAIALVMLTHNLMAFLFLPVSGIWAIFLLVIYKQKQALIPIICSFVLGIGLAAFFVLPVIFEKQYAHTETLLGGYFDYRQHFVSYKQLFFSNHFGYGSDYLGVENDDVTLSVGILQWIIAAFAILLAWLKRKTKPKLLAIVVFLAVLEVGVLFMMHAKSSFVWQIVPNLNYFQFPWRFLTLSTFLISIIGAIGLSLLEVRRHQMICGVVIIGGLLLFYAPFFQPKTWFSLTDQEKFSGANWDRQLTISIFDYLPIYAKEPPPGPAFDLPEVLDGNVSFSSYLKRSHYQIGQYSATDSAKIRLPIFDFPGMVVTVDGQMVPHDHLDCRNEPFCRGLINVIVPEGTHTLQVQLTNTPIRTIANSISLVTFVIIAGLIVVLVRQRKEDMV